MIKVITIIEGNDDRATREVVMDDTTQRTLGDITSFDGDLWSAYALTPVDDVHKNGKHVVSGIEGRQAAVDLVVMMHAYWTLPAFEKEKET
jgi:hypothetical protein